MIVCPDDYLLIGGRYVWTPERVKVAWDRARDTFKGHLTWGKPRKVVLLMGAPAAGKSYWLSSNMEPGVLYFDATFDLPWKREPFINEALAAKLEVEIVWIDTPLEICIGRNASRSSDRQVPEEVLREMFVKIATNPPTCLKGVSIIRVQP